MDLNNLNMEDLKAKVLTFTDKKTLIKSGIAFGAIIFFLIIYYSILNPIVNTKKIQLDDMIVKQKEIMEFNQLIKANKNKIKKLGPDFEKYSTLFHTRAEVEGLYQTLSDFAGQNGLVISKIEKKKPEEISKSDLLGKKKKKKKKKATKKKSLKNIAYYKIPVDFEITGNFLGYIKFKRQISLSKKMLNFDKESIKVVQGTSAGTIKVDGTLTIVGLANDFF
jgi:Tfp pilus assembly protein PilO